MHSFPGHAADELDGVRFLWTIVQSQVLGGPAEARIFLSPKMRCPERLLDRLLRTSLEAGHRDDVRRPELVNTLQESITRFKVRAHGRQFVACMNQTFPLAGSISEANPQHH